MCEKIVLTKQTSTIVKSGPLRLSIYLPAMPVAIIVAEWSSLRTADHQPSHALVHGQVSSSWLMTTPDLHLEGTMHTTEMILWSMILIFTLSPARTYNGRRLLNTSCPLTATSEFGTVRTEFIDWNIVWLTVLVYYVVGSMTEHEKTVFNVLEKHQRHYWMQRFSEWLTAELSINGFRHDYR